MQWGPLRAGTARGPVSLTQPCVGKSSCARPSTAVRACGGREPGTRWCLGAIHPASKLPREATRKPLRGEGRRKKDECRKGRQSHAKPHTSHIQARCMRQACGVHAGRMRDMLVFSSYSARVLLVFSSYSPRVHLAFSGGAWRGNPAAQANCCLVLTAKGRLLFKLKHTSISTCRRLALAPGAGIPGRTCARGHRPSRWRTRRLRPVPPA